MISNCRHGLPILRLDQVCHENALHEHVVTWYDEPYKMPAKGSPYSEGVTMPNKSIKFFPPVAGNDPAVSILNSKSKEPAINVGFVASMIIGTLLGLPEFFPNIGNQSWYTWGVFVTIISAPLVSGFITRQKVWSPASVLDAVEEGIAEARKYQNKS